MVEEGSGKNGTVSATHEKERDTEALLLHQVLLTIGTFGHSAPQPDQEKQQQQQQQQEEDQEADHSAVVKPTASVPHSSTLEISKPPESDEKKQKQEVIMMIDQEMVISREPLLKEDKEKSIEKRTTLADLLAADQEATSDDRSAADKKHATCPTKNVLKKIKNTESPPASKKMHWLITRMLMKKIHPDLARGDQEQHARRGAAADGAGEGRYGDFRLRRGG